MKWVCGLSPKNKNKIATLSSSTITYLPKCIDQRPLGTISKNSLITLKETLQDIRQYAQKQQYIRNPSVRWARNKRSPFYCQIGRGGGGGGEITAIISLGIDLLSGFVPLTKSVINIWASNNPKSMVSPLLT